MSMSENVREIVLDTLVTLDTENKKSHLLIRDILDKYDYLDARDKAFFKRVTEGTIYKKITIDFCIDSYSKKPVDKLKPIIRSLLRMSVYQILFMEKVPDNAVCDEAVKLCRKRSFEEFTPFVNAILRNICKDKEKLPDLSRCSSKINELSVKYSCPEWLVRMFTKEQENPEALLASFDTVKATCVKITDPGKKEKLFMEWENANIHFKKSEYIEDAYLLYDFEGIETVPGFLEGCLIVQDESSMLAAKATGVKRGDKYTVIDVCAAPGGKTSYVASAMAPFGRVLSFDVSENKVDLIKENLERLKLENAEASVKDATVYSHELYEKADILIADVPCSGLGVMSRKSDIKYNISNEAMQEICSLQKQILLNVSKYVKPGGVLVYSTCTIHKAENEKMVKFITENLPFEGDSLKPYVPEMFKIERNCDYAVQLLPNVDGTDGFFVARFVKKG